MIMIRESVASRSFRSVARHATGILLAVIAFSAAPASAANFTWLGSSGSTANWSDGANWAGGVAPTATGTHTLTWDATSTGNKASFNDVGGLKLTTLTYTNAPAGIVLTGSGISFTTTAAFFVASPGVGTITDNLDMVLPSAAVFRNNNEAVLGGVISGGATSVTFERGTFAVYGANTFSTPVTLASGNGGGTYIVNTLKNQGQAQSLGTGSLVQFGAVNGQDIARVYYTGGITSTDKGFQIGGNANAATGGVYANGTGPLTWTGTQSQAAITGTNSTTRTFTLGGFNTDANTWQAAIINNSGTGATMPVALTKAGRGTWVLSGANTFTGAALKVDSGSLVLDYATNSSVLTSALTPTLGGSTLEFKARSSGSSAQTLGNVTAAAESGLNTVRVNQNGGAGMGVTLGTVTINGRSALLFDLMNSAASSVTIGTAIAPDTATNGNILIRTSAGAYDFAVNGGSAANALSAREASATIGATTGNAALDYVFTNTGTIGNGSTGSSISAQSLRIAPTLDNQTMTISNVGAFAGGGNAGLSVDGGGLIYDGGSRNFTIAASGSNANGVSIRASNSGVGFNLHHMGTGTLTIGERVYLGYSGGSPGTGQSNMPLGVFGTGLIDWKGSVNATNNGGLLTISGAIVRISGTVDPVLLDSTSTGKGAMNIALNNGGVLEAVNGNITRTIGTGSGAIQWKGDGGFSAFGGDRSVILASGSAQTWGSTNFVPSDNALVLSSASSDSTIDFQNALALGSLQRVVQVANGSAAIDARLSGVLSSGLTGGLVKAGAGTLELTGANSYAGETWVQSGALLVNGDQSAATGAMIAASGATLGGSGTIGGAATISGILAPGSGGIGTLAAVNGVTWNAGNAWLFQLGTAAASLNDAAASTNNDLLAVTGAFTQGTGSTFTFDFLNTGSDGWYRLVDYTTTSFATGTNASFQASNLPGGKTANFVVDSSSTALYVQIVPEPSTLVLVTIGGAAVIAGLRRRGVRRSEATERRRHSAG